MTQVTPGPVADAPRRRVPLNIGTALAVAVIISLIAFLLTTDHGSPVVDDARPSAEAAEPAESDTPVVATPTAAVAAAQPATTEAPPPTVVATGALGRNFTGGGEAAASSYSVLALTGEITNMGPTEIGFVTNFPSTDYTWQRVELASSGGFDTSWLGELDGRIVAVSLSWTESDFESRQSLVTFESDDGLDWAEVGDYELPADTWVSRVVSDGERLYAFVESWEERDGARHSVYSSENAVDWVAAEIDLRAAEGEHAYIQNAAAGPAGIVVAASFESYPEEQPALLDFGDYRVELDHMYGTYRLIDAAGDEVLAGDLDELFNWGAEGQRVYEPASGELLVTIPYDVWEQAYMGYYDGYGGGSPLPIPMYSEPPTREPGISIEYGGFVVMVDEEGGEYMVTDADSGEQIAVGSMDYLYQGPPPRFVDSDSGDVLLSVTWDEWYKAEEQAYVHVESQYYEYSSRMELLTSGDGQTWTAEPVPTRTGAHVSYIAATDDGFAAMVNTYGDYGEFRSVWTFDAGSWTSTGIEESSDLWLYEVTEASDRFLGVGEGSSGPALWSSVNGIDWVSEFAIVPQDDGSYVFLSSVVSDGETTGVLAHRERWADYKPLVLEKDGYTLTFEDGDTALRVVDASSEPVLTLGWEVYEEGGTDAVTWEDGVTYINLNTGEVISISDEEAYEAMESRWSDQGELGLSVFLNDGSQWSEAIVEVDGGLSGATHLQMAGGKIIIAGFVWDEQVSYRSSREPKGSLVIIVGTPSGD